MLHVFSLFLGLFFIAHTAIGKSFNAQKYQFNPNLTYEFVESSNFYDPYLGFLYPKLFTFGVNYIDSPFVVQNTSNPNDVRNILSNIQSYQLGYHTMSSFKMSFGLHSSIDRVHMEFDPNQQVQVNQTQTSIGDTYLNVKYRFFEDENWVFSSKLNLGLGTGNSQYFLTDGSSVAIMGIVERMFDSFRISGNLGYKYAPDAKFNEIDYSHRIQTALGGFWAINRTLGSTLEFKKDFNLKPSIASGSEIHLGIQKKIINEGMTVFSSISTGSINNLFGSKDYSGSDYRLALGLKWTPSFETTNGSVIKSNQLSFKPNSEYMKNYFSKNNSNKEVLNRKKIISRYNYENKNALEKTVIKKDEIKKIQQETETNVLSNTVNQEEIKIDPQLIISNKSEDKIKNSLTNEEIQICKFYELVKIEFPIKIYFNFNKYNIESSEYSELNRAVSFINKYADRFDYVKVEGHTDSRGSKGINKWISKMRAKEVTKYLKSKSEKSVAFKWFGLGSQNRSVANAMTRQEHAKNRRGEIRIEFVVKKNGLVCPGERGYENF